MNITNLPPEILFIIFEHVDGKALSSLSLTCTYFYHLAAKQSIRHVRDIIGVEPVTDNYNNCLYMFNVDIDKIEYSRSFIEKHKHTMAYYYLTVDYDNIEAKHTVSIMNSVIYTCNLNLYKLIYDKFYMYRYVFPIENYDGDDIVLSYINNVKDIEHMYGAMFTHLCINNRPNMLDQLLTKYKNIEHRLNHTLYHTHTVEIIKVLFKHGIIVYHEDMLLSYSDHDNIKYILDNYNINSKNMICTLALSLCFKRFDIIRLLLEYDIDLTNDDIIVGYCCSAGLGILKLLLEKGLLIDKLKSYACCKHAIHNNDIDIVKYINHTVGINYEYRYNLLDLAISDGDIDIVEYICDIFGDIYVAPYHIDILFRRSNLDIVTMLTKKRCLHYDNDLKRLMLTYVNHLDVDMVRWMMNEYQECVIEECYYANLFDHIMWCYNSRDIKDKKKLNDMIIMLLSLMNIDLIKKEYVECLYCNDDVDDHVKKILM